MKRTYLSVTFADEAGKTGIIRVNEPKANIQAGEVQAAAKTIVDAGVFRAKGKFTAAKKADLVSVTSSTLFGA